MLFSFKEENSRTWIGLPGLSEINHTQKDNYCMIPLISGTVIGKFLETVEQRLPRAEELSM